MFKKRIRVACVVFATMLVLLIGCSVWWKITEKNSMGTGKLEVIVGSADMVDGITVSVGRLEKRANGILRRYNHVNRDRNAEYIYITKTAEMVGNQTKTGIGYENYNVSLPRDQWCYTSLSVDFPQYKTSGRHRVKGGELSYDLNWYLCDGYDSYIDNLEQLGNNVYRIDSNRDNLEQSGITEYRIEDYVTFTEEDEYLYYYDGMGSDRYEAFCMTPEDGSAYRGTLLCELNDVSYGYIDREPEIYFQCTHFDQNGKRLDVWDLEETRENVDNRSFVNDLYKFGMPEVHMTVNKGIYRFDENGIATCVFPMTEYADGFSFLWLVAEKEENTFIVIGTKENRLLAYRCNLHDGSIEEQVLWNAEEEPDVFNEWVENARRYEMADMVSDGERSYLYYVGDLAVFEKETCVFEGRIELPKEGSNYWETFGNKSLDTDSVVDKLEIRLMK